VIVVMKLNAPQDQVKAVKEKLFQEGFKPHLIQGVEKQVIGAVGKQDISLLSGLETMEGVEKIIQVSTPYQLVSREAKEEDSIVEVDGVKIGGRELAVMAGPCAVEDFKQMSSIARFLKAQGISILRGGAYKPRTSPYSFQGLGIEGLKILYQASRETGLKIVSEVVSTSDMEVVSSYVDMLQIGARNMQNYSLLKEAGKTKKPVLLKRGMSSSIEEWLMSAEYILSEGNPNVVLCERGIKTFEKYTRSTLDISAISLAKQLSHLPVLADPSHSGGSWKLVPWLSKAAVSAGADGLLVEVHPVPSEAWCDGPQSLNFSRFEEMLRDLKPVAETAGRTLPGSESLTQSLKEGRQ